MTMRWTPPTMLEIRGVVTHVADGLDKYAGVMAYLSTPAMPPEIESRNDPIACAIASWDPFMQPRVSKSDPAWIALEKARQALLNAFAAGDLKAHVLHPDGTLEPLAESIWRRSDAADLLRLRHDRISVWVDRKELEAWKNSKTQPAARRHTGPVPRLRAEIEGKMRQTPVNVLKGYSKKQLPGVFGGMETTCYQARLKVLAEMEAVTPTEPRPNPDQTLTTNK